MDNQFDIISESWKIHPLFGILAALVVAVFAFLLDRKSLKKDIDEFKQELKRKNQEILQMQEHHYKQILLAQKETIEATKSMKEVINNLKEVFQAYLSEIRDDLKSLSHNPQ